MPGTLSALGIAQAHESAALIAGRQFDRCLCSDLKRCKDTAEILLKDRQEIPIIYTKMLRERDWGAATGAIIGGPNKIDIPDDAESMPALMARVRVFLDYVKRTYPDQTLLVVSHGFVLRILQAVNLSVDFHEIEMLHNAEVRDIEVL